MSRASRLLVAAALLVPHQAWAQVQPHRAEYSLRFGAAANAPRVGTAVQNITLDCAGLHVERDLVAGIALTPSWKVNLASRLDGEEERDGSGFRYHTVQILNGAERETRGTIERIDGKTDVEIVSADGSRQLSLPQPTVMPVAAIRHVVERLRAGETSFSVLVFVAEAAGEAFQVDVKELEPGALRAAPPALKPVAVPATRSWPVLLTVMRRGQQDQKPLATLRVRIFESGVLDRLTFDAGVVTVTADLQALEMHEAPNCSDR